MQLKLLIPFIILLASCHNREENAYRQGLMDGAAYAYNYRFYPSIWHQDLMVQYRERKIWWNKGNLETKAFWDSVDLHYKPIWDSVYKEMENK